MADTPRLRKERAPIRVIHAWEPPKYDYMTVIALRSVFEGTANEGQQKAALKWIIWNACETYGFSFRPGGTDGDRETCLAEGRRFVGNAITFALNMTGDTLEKLKRSENDGRRSEHEPDGD